MSGRKFRKYLMNHTNRAINRAVRDMGLSKVDRKWGAFDGISDEDVKKLNKTEKISRFIKAVFMKDNVSLKALSEGVNADGGFQVPEEFAAEVNRVVEDFGIVRKLSRKIPMISDTMNVPRLSASVQVTFPGENTAGSESQPTWENVQLLAKTAVGLTVSSNELLADANIDVVNLLVELFGEALASQEDLQGLRGTGSPFTGILNEAGVAEVVMANGNLLFADVEPDDLRDIATQIKPWALSGAGYVMHRTVWGEIQKKKASDGTYFISVATPVLGGVAGPQGVNAGLSVGTIWGYPVWLSEQMPATSDGSQTSKTFLIFGNLTHLYFGDRQIITMAISDAATVGSNNTFEQNQSALRMTERYALAVGLPAALARLKTSAT